MKKVELLAPAGDLEKLKIAYLYGADACFVGGKEFSLRARASNFSIEDLKEGASFAHKLGKKLYVTTNIVPHHENYDGLVEYLKDLESAEVDGIIAASPLIIKTAKKETNLKVHISTQQSITNNYHLKYYEDLNVDRAVLGRELSVNEIKEIISKTNLEIEVFIHGGMCSSFSGRCTLSNTFTLRDANRGGCAHSCRWNYNVYDLEDKISTDTLFSMGSKDLQSIKEIPNLIAAGVDSLKIEGRMKSLHYVATVVRTYRKLIDEYLTTGKVKDFSFYENEINKAENRSTNTGFLNEDNLNDLQLYHLDSLKPSQTFVGLVVENKENLVLVEQRNYFEVGELLEVLTPDDELKEFIVTKMYDEDYNEIDVARHPKQKIYIKIPFKVKEYDMLRRKDAEV